MSKESYSPKSEQAHYSRAYIVVSGVKNLIEGKHPGDPEIMAFSDLIDFTREDIISNTKGIGRRNDRKKSARSERIN